MISFKQSVKTLVCQAVGHDSCTTEKTRKSVNDWWYYREEYECLRCGRRRVLHWQQPKVEYRNDTIRI